MSRKSQLTWLVSDTPDHLSHWKQWPSPQCCAPISWDRRITPSRLGPLRRSLLFQKLCTSQNRSKAWNLCTTIRCTCKCCLRWRREAQNSSLLVPQLHMERAKDGTRWNLCCRQAWGRENLAPSCSSAFLSRWCRWGGLTGSGEPWRRWWYWLCCRRDLIMLDIAPSEIVWNVSKKWRVWGEARIRRAGHWSESGGAFCELRMFF